MKDLNERLAKAANEGDAKEFNNLIANGADVNYTIFGRGILNSAAEGGNEEILFYVFNHVINNLSNDNKELAFLDAVRKDQLISVKFLLSKYIRNERGILHAILNKSEKVALYLIENNKDGFYRLYDDSNASILKRAVIHNLPLIVDTLSKKYPQMLDNGAGIPSGTPWKIALSAFNINIVKTLARYQNNVDVNEVINYFTGNTLLHEIVIHTEDEKLTEAVKFAVIYNININALNTKGKTARELLLGRKKGNIESFDQGILAGAEIVKHNKLLLQSTISYVAILKGTYMPIELINMILSYVKPIFDEKLETYEAAILKALVCKDSSQHIKESFNSKHPNYAQQLQNERDSRAEAKDTIRMLTQ